MLIVYKHHGDAILVSAPGCDDVLLHVFMPEYERREMLRIAGHNHDAVERRIAQEIIIFHGPAAQAAQRDTIRRLIGSKAPAPEIRAAADRLAHLIIEQETMHHA